VSEQLLLGSADKQRDRGRHGRIEGIGGQQRPGRRPGRVRRVRPARRGARWRKQRELEGVKEKPNPWPIIERAFPRIAATIRDQWGKRALDDYFSKLVVDDRGSRQGFPPDVLSAIMEVARLHAAQHRFKRPICPLGSRRPRHQVVVSALTRRSRPAPE